MFLVHHDHARAGQGGEHRRAGADDDAGPAGTGVGPGLESFAVRQPRMQHGHAAVKAIPESPQGLGGEVDFRHQHQSLFAALETAGDGLQIDFRLAASGIAEKQQGLELSRRYRRQSFALFRAQRQGCFRQQRGFGLRLLVFRNGGGEHQRLHQALPVQRPQGFPADIVGGECLRGNRFPRAGEALDYRLLLRCPGQGGLRQSLPQSGQPPVFPLATGQGFSLAQQRRQRGEQGVSHRVLIVAGGPEEEIEQPVIDQRFRVQHRLDGFESLALLVSAALALHHQTDDGAPTEGDTNPAAGTDIPRLLPRRQIIEQLAQR